MSFTDKLVTIAENQQRVFDAGFAAGVLQGGGYVDVDPIPVTATGNRFVSVNDVSEIPHDVEVNVSGDVATKVIVSGKNLLDCGTVEFVQSQNLFNSTTAPLPAGTYTFSANTSSTDTDATQCAITYWWGTGFNEYSTLLLSRNVRASGSFTSNLPIVKIVAYASTSYRRADGDTAIFTDCQLEIGGSATAYEPYKPPVEYSIGRHVKSVSPSMLVMTDDDTATIEVQYHRSHGFQVAYDFFWDVYQKNGTRTDYGEAFRGRFSWTDEIFKPKYPIISTGIATNMFYGAANLTTLKHVSFDVSKATNLSYAFCTSGFHELPVIDMRGVPSTTRMTSVFYRMENCTKIEKVYLHGGLLGDSFERLGKLVEIRTEGEFVESLDMHWSPLSRASIESIMSSLSDTVTGQTATFNKAAVEAAFTEDEWNTLVATKQNWTIGLA